VHSDVLAGLVRCSVQGGFADAKQARNMHADKKNF